jgi:hypothetical protein
MSTIKHKLTENIIYLQNEIRKRDELLESSEFGDFDLIGMEESDSVLDEDLNSRGGDFTSVRGGGEDEMGGGSQINTAGSARKQSV